jgi:hypothetical protein
MISIHNNHARVSQHVTSGRCKYEGSIRNYVIAKFENFVTNRLKYIQNKNVLDHKLEES